VASEIAMILLDRRAGSQEKQAPERQVDPPEMLRVPLVLQIVKYRHCGQGHNSGAVKPGLNRQSRPRVTQRAGSTVCSQARR
jgi:hypothetical protein